MYLLKTISSLSRKVLMLGVCLRGVFFLISVFFFGLLLYNIPILFIVGWQGFEPSFQCIIFRIMAKHKESRFAAPCGFPPLL